jgi:hypothetical protein
MRGLELAIKQIEAAGLQPRDEMRQRDLRRVGRAADHAFAKKGPPERQPV